jgi:hypothetical protein
MKTKQYRIIASVKALDPKGLNRTINIDMFVKSISDMDICNILRQETYSHDIVSIVDSYVDIYEVICDNCSVYRSTRTYTGTQLEICVDMYINYI